MSVEIIGMITTQLQSETLRPQGSVIDRDHVRRFAQAHEAAGFDRILVPQHSTGPDASQVIAYASTVTERVNFLLAHRPGFIAPAFAARQLATLENFTGGRLAVHIISGGSDEEQRRDGDFLDHDQRYARTDEYLEVLRRTWTSEAPFDHEGAHYRYEKAFSEVKPLQKPHLPIYFGGASEAALRVAGKHADAYALWGESLEQTRELTQRVRAEAAQHGRGVRFSVSFRPILAETEAKAWAKAEHILAETRRLRVEAGWSRGGPQQSEGARRLLAAAERGDVVDERLWTAIARETGARSNSTALVGTPEQVAQALLKYVDLGVGTLLIRGFDPLDDAVDYGRELIPRVRALVAQREARQGAQEAVAA
ncbi:LLM class flavin-dependent oxidoreductase [Azohydromonas caseinilytica]|uniref:LLM class flavin-dependent oxidoreductase n=1 Tax=Azohydromonas caseinilytica TaxID=2728836 RepID=A0A848FAV8_9BURK|nr:LLM class flavin-dependent oxidoreductase [Azohydromonas caseinilytica]NML16428.1 LLM class flavin-dependent oxidoreductase [Azohydromonas caseinilytica]